MKGEAEMKSEQAGELQILIIGGSLAGLTSALALARIGAQVTVLERAAGQRSGAALAVHPADLDTVIGHEPAAVVLERLAGPGHRPHGAQSVAWTDLRDGLARAALDSPSISLLAGRRVQAVGQDEEAVWARTDDGTEYGADALVGAYGHRSRVRRLVSPERPDADFAGYLLWVGIAQEQDVHLRGQWPSGLDIQTRGDQILLGYPLPGSQGSLLPGQRRLGWAWYDAGRSGLLASTGAVRDGVVHHSIHASDVPGGVYRELPARARSTWSAPWAAAIADSARRRAITGTPIAEYVPDRLVRGRTALVGNAAHVPTPMTGSGFAAALDDAASLADALRGARSGRVADVLRDYEHDRLPAARRLVQSGQGFSRSFAGRR